MEQLRSFCLPGTYVTDKSSLMRESSYIHTTLISYVPSLRALRPGLLLLTPHTTAGRPHTTAGRPLITTGRPQLLLADLTLPHEALTIKLTLPHQDWLINYDSRFPEPGLAGTATVSHEDWPKRSPRLHTHNNTVYWTREAARLPQMT